MIRNNADIKWNWTQGTLLLGENVYFWPKKQEIIRQVEATLYFSAKTNYVLAILTEKNTFQIFDETCLANIPTIVHTNSQFETKLKRGPKN